MLSHIDYDPAIALAFDTAPARDVEHIRARFVALLDLCDGDIRADAAHQPCAIARLALTLVADIRDHDRL